MFSARFGASGTQETVGTAAGGLRSFCCHYGGGIRIGTIRRDEDRFVVVKLLLLLLLLILYELEVNAERERHFLTLFLTELNVETSLFFVYSSAVVCGSSSAFRNTTFRVNRMVIL